MGYPNAKVATPMRDYHYKILIITLYAGENEYDACQQSVREQIFNGSIEHRLVEGQSNIEAHKTCYQMTMDKADDYDLCIKMDADMVFNRPTAIADIITFWNNQDQPDHMVFAVQDCIPDRLSIGVHVFSNRCTWNIDKHDPLFVDPNPSYPGHHVKQWHAPAPFINHAPNPSLNGAYHFGVHRALKAFQFDRFFASPQAIEAFRILQSTADHYNRTDDETIKYALIGAEAIRTRALTIKTGDKGDKGDKHNIAILDTTGQPIDFWMHHRRAWLYWWGVTGWRVLPLAIWSKIKKIMGI